MDDQLKYLLENCKKSMEASVTHLENELLNIRAGKANPSMLKSVHVNYYGNETPINQLANVNTPDSKTIVIQPWEKSILPDIEKAISYANLGFNPMNNGDNIIINIPPLTEERRKELAKMAKSLSENAKISIRNVRKNSNNEIKKLDYSEDQKNNYIIDIQNITDKLIEKVDNIYQLKEKEILTI